MVGKEDASLAKVEMRAELQREVVRHVLAGGIEAGHLVLNGKSASEDRAERWSRFVRQLAKVDLPMRRMIHYEDAETVFV